LSTEIEYDPDAASELLNQLYADQETGFQVFMIATEGDPSLEAVLVKTANALSDIGMEVFGPDLVDREAALEIQAEMVDAGRGVLWLDRR
jgi:hypothetical protein